MLCRRRGEHRIATFSIDRTICKFLVQLVMQAVECQFEAVRDAELVIDLSQIVLDDLLGGAQLERDFLVPLALGNAGDDRHLFWRQAWLAARAHQCSGLRPVRVDHPVHRLIVDPGLAGGDSAHAADQQIGRDGARDDAAHAAR